jgi:hypothetical protein
MILIHNAFLAVNAAFADLARVAVGDLFRDLLTGVFGSLGMLVRFRLVHMSFRLVDGLVGLR